MHTQALSQGLVLVSSILAQVHHSQMPGPPLKFGRPCLLCLHEAVHASLTCMRSSIQTLNARGAEKKAVPCPPGPPSGGYTFVVKMNARLRLQAARRASCKLSWHGQPQANKASMEARVCGMGAACGCGARGPRWVVVVVVVAAVVVAVVVLGTNKDWGPQNKVSELILEFAWCPLRASMGVFHRFEKEFWCGLLFLF